MASEFLRDYQEYAVGEIFRTFAELDPRRVARGEELPEDKRITIVVSPTASGKTAVMKRLADRLSEAGHSTLVLTHLVTVARQCREAGLTATTVQNLFFAFRSAAEARQRGRKARVWAAKKIGLPESFFDKDIMILVDESHWAAENLTKIYRETIEATGARMVVGFTATPRRAGAFNTVDLSDRAGVHVAPPLKTVLYSHSLLTLPHQLSLFPAPGLIFTQSVGAAALVASAMNIISQNPREAVLIVGNPRASLEAWVRRMFPPAETPPRLTDEAGRLLGSISLTPAVSQGVRPSIEKGKSLLARLGKAAAAAASVPGEDDSAAGVPYVLSFRPAGGVVGGAGAGAGAGVSGVAGAGPGAGPGAGAEALAIDRAERRLSIITMLLVMDRLSRTLSRAAARRELEAATTTLGGLPAAGECLQLVDIYRPELSSAYRRGMAGDAAATMEISAAVRGMKLASLSNPGEFRGDSGSLGGSLGGNIGGNIGGSLGGSGGGGGPYNWGVSVYKISTGFNLPEIRTVCMAESAVDSEVLYRQRAGRGARKTADKSFYDLVDCVYLDPMSDPGGMGDRVSWLSTMVSDPDERRRLEGQDLLLRE